jgi:hypothetical protein
VPYGNTFWDSGAAGLLHMELPPTAASVLRSSLRARQHQQAAQQPALAATSPPLASRQRFQSQPGLEVTQSVDLEGDSSLLAVDPAQSFSRTFAAPLSAGRLQSSPRSNQRSSRGGRTRTPLEQSMAAQSCLIYPAGKGMAAEQQGPVRGATMGAEDQAGWAAPAPGPTDGPPPPDGSSSSSGSGGSVPAAEAAAAAAGSSRAALGGTPLHLEELYSRNEAKLKMLAALQGGADDNEALETFLARCAVQHTAARSLS